MIYELNELQQEIQSLARRVAQEKVLPARAHLDETEEYPYEVMKALAQADLMGVYIPE